MKQLLRRGCAAVLSLVLAGSLSAQAWVLGGTYNEGLAPVREVGLYRRRRVPGHRPCL